MQGTIRSLRYFFGLKQTKWWFSYIVPVVLMLGVLGDWRYRETRRNEMMKYVLFATKQAELEREAHRLSGSSAMDCGTFAESQIKPESNTALERQRVEACMELAHRAGVAFRSRRLVTLRGAHFDYDGDYYTVGTSHGDVYSLSAVSTSWPGMPAFISRKWTDPSIVKRKKGKGEVLVDFAKVENR